MTVKAIVTDIEGTTSSISFVHETLFPYASKALPEFLRNHYNEAVIGTILDDVRLEAGKPAADCEEVIEILQSWISEDKKATSLKTLQGHIWKNGYECGDFSGHVYPDAAANLQRWAADGIRLYVYSSGSVDAQKLLFGYSDAGDMQPLFRGYFDTKIGHKKEAESYRKIVHQLNMPASDILFLSDVTGELDAAATAGMQTMQLVRDDTVMPGSHPVAADFDEVTRRL